MRERGITEEEVSQALRNVLAESEARTWDRVNVWGMTDAGRMLRITTHRADPSYIITVVAPGEGQR
jgi:hypothetical protein